MLKGDAVPDASPSLRFQPVFQLISEEVLDAIVGLSVFSGFYIKQVTCIRTGYRQVATSILIPKDIV
jgi:hypothetical protein